MPGAPVSVSVVGLVCAGVLVSVSGVCVAASPASVSHVEMVCAGVPALVSGARLVCVHSGQAVRRQGFWLVIIQILLQK